MHKVTREQDEYVCTCGLRWDINEDDPHPTNAREYIEQVKYKLNKGRKWGDDLTAEGGN